MYLTTLEFKNLEEREEMNDNLIVKEIEKLEDLQEFKWEYRNKHFSIGLQGSNRNIGLGLYQHGAIQLDGGLMTDLLKFINQKNLLELEFYGLKVIVIEKPKLSKRERHLLELLYEDVYIARDTTGVLYAYDDLPCLKFVGTTLCTASDNTRFFELNREAFKFITWESQKAWSKAELLELEVEE